MKHYDVIVAGTGSMGSATCYFLAQRGYKVLGLEQFDTTPHENGSHAGQSRIIRKAYFEHPDYVPLLERAYKNWAELEELTGEKIYHQTGLLYCAPKHHSVIKGVKTAAEKFNIQLVPAGNSPALSYFRSGKDGEVLFEPEAGFLQPEKCIRLYCNEAIKKAAVIQTGEKMLKWEKQDGIIKVVTSEHTYHASKLIITAGAWAGQLLKELKIPLKVTRQVIVWTEPENPSSFTPDKFPCWLIAGDNIHGAWYGFPYLSGEAFPGPAGLKFALHYPGDEANPDHVKREVTAGELKEIIDEAKQYFVPAGYKVTAVKTCLYTNTPDENFIIDHLPGYDGDVTIACGFSGHGFKFGSVTGEILADLSMTGATALPIEFLGLKRFQ